MALLRRTAALCAALTLLMPAHAANATDSPSGEDVTSFISSLSPEDQETISRFIEREQQFQQYQPNGALTVDESGNVVDHSERPVYSVRTTSWMKDENLFVGELIIGAKYAKEAQRCTANHVRGSFWLTAAHCFESTPTQTGKFDGTITQYNGKKAYVQRFFLHPNPEIDLALVRVSSGLTPTTPALSSARPQIGTKFAVTGYGGQYDGVPTRSTLRVDGYDFTRFSKETRKRWTGQMRLRAEQPLSDPTTHGDSGAGLFAYPNTLHGVLSGGKDSNPDYAVPTADHIAWINKTIRDNSTATDEDIIKPIRDCFNSSCLSSSGRPLSGIDWVKDHMEANQ